MSSLVGHFMSGYGGVVVSWLVQSDLHISADIWVGVLVDGQRGRRVLNEYMRDADRYILEILRQRLLNLSLRYKA